MRALLHDKLTRLMVAMLSVMGVGLLMAALCVRLVPPLGLAGALAVTGLVMIGLAGAVTLLRPARPVLPPAVPRPDPMVQMVYDLCYTFGRSLRRDR